MLPCSIGDQMIVMFLQFVFVTYPSKNYVKLADKSTFLSSFVHLGAVRGVG